MAFKPHHGTPPRQAFVIARAYEKSNEFVVSLSHGSIISQHIYNGTGFPLLNLEEWFAANDLAFKYPPFICWVHVDINVQPTPKECSFNELMFV